MPLGSTPPLSPGPGPANSTPQNPKPVNRPGSIPSHHRFPGKLATRVLLSVWLLCIIPALFIGALRLNNVREMLRSQVITRIENLVKTQVSAIDQDNALRQTILESLSGQKSFNKDVNLLLSQEPDQSSSPANSEISLARERIFLALRALNQTSPHPLFAGFFILNPEGVILLSDQPGWQGLDLGSQPAFQPVLGSNNSSVGVNAGTASPPDNNSKSFVLANPEPLFANQIAVFVTLPFMDEKGEITGTIVGTAVLKTPDIIAKTFAFYPTAKIYFLTGTSGASNETPSLIPLDVQGQPDQQKGRLLPASDQKTSLLAAIQTNDDRSGSGSYRSVDGTPVISYIQQSASGFGLLIEIPQDAVYQPLTDLLPSASIFLLVTLLIIGGLIWLGVRRIISPLLEVVQASQLFAEGNWFQRIEVKRNDELGLLADSFNHMADEISNLYQTLETQVEERTRHLRTASDVAQLSTIVNDLGSMLEKVSQLVLERFNCFNVCIYLVDPSNAYAVLRQSAGPIGETLKRQIGKPANGSSPRRGSDKTIYRLNVNSQSLPGWVAANNQIRAITDTRDYPFIIRDNLLPTVRSEAGIPISITVNALGTAEEEFGDQVLSGKTTSGGAGGTTRILGVLVVQSTELGAFTEEKLSVLQTLANQVAIAIQNITNLQSSRDVLQGTSILYQTSHRIITSSTKEEVFQAVADALKQTSYISGLMVVNRPQSDEELEPDSNLPNSGQGFKPSTLDFYHIFDPQHREIPESTRRNHIPVWDLGATFAFGPDLRIKAEVASPPVPVILSDLTRTPSDLVSLMSTFRNLGGRSAAIIPIFIAGRFSALLIIASRERSAFSSALIQPFSNLVEIISQSIERLFAVEQSRKRQNELQITAQVGLSIALETDLNRIYQVVHQQVIRLVGEVDFLIALYYPKSNQIEIPYVYEHGEALSVPPFPLGEGLTSVLIKSRQSLMLVEDTARQARDLGAIITGKPAQSWLGVPLLIGDSSSEEASTAGKVLGALIIQDSENEHRFNADDLHLFNALAPQIAVVIRNGQLIEETRQLARQYDEERTLFNALVNNIPDRIYFKDRQSRYVRVNPGILAQFGLSDPAGIIGKSDFDFFSEKHAGQAYDDEQHLMETGEAIEGKLERETWPGRSDTWALSTKAPLRDSEGKIIGLLGISRDVTDLIASQEISERRARQLQTTAEIARDVTGELQLDELLQRAIGMIKQRFGFYHASVFLLDPAGEFAILRESTGEAGRQLKNEGHKLGVGSRSMVGQATSRGESVVANDVTQDSTYYPNPLLPQTRSELAVPLKISAPGQPGRVVGALDVQSDQLNAFSIEDIAILRILADQLAVAVVNANLFANSERNLIQHRLLHQITTAAASSASVEEALSSAVQGLQVILEGVFVSILLFNPAENVYEVKAWAGYSNQQDLTRLKIHPGEGIVGQAVQERALVNINDTRSAPQYIGIEQDIRSEIAIPLIYRDEVMGVLNIESKTAGAFKEEDQELLGTLGGSLAAIIANTSLVEQIRRQVDRQRLLLDITGKIRRSVDFNSILETSATEIGKVIGARRAKIQLNVTAAPLANQSQMGSLDPLSPQERDDGSDASRRLDPGMGG